MIICNHNELMEAFQTSVFERFFITLDAEQVIKESLEHNIEMLVDVYGENGAGGYIRIIPENISTKEGIEGYFSELSKYALKADESEFDDILVQSDTKQVHLQLFAMNEYHLLLLYVKDGDGCSEIF